jgi:hypothetical protein
MTNTKKGKEINIFKSLARSNVFSTKSEEQEVNLVWPNLYMLTALHLIVILNLLFFNKLRQIIPEIRSERRDLLIFIFILKMTGTFTPVHSAGYLILLCFCLFDLCTLFVYIPCTCLQPLGVKLSINKVS